MRPPNQERLQAPVFIVFQMPAIRAVKLVAGARNQLNLEFCWSAAQTCARVIR